MAKQQFPMMLAKEIEEVADLLIAKYVKQAERSERDEPIIGDKMQHIIEIVGDFEILDLSDMDMWGGRFKFELYDHRTEDDDERRVRGDLAMQVPEMSAFFTCPTGMRVFKQCKIINRVTTITERLVDGKVKDKQEDVQEQESEEWEEITKEFATRGMRKFGWSE